MVLVGHDNFGSREIFSRIVDDHPQLDFLLLVTTGLYYRRSWLGSVFKLLREASWTFCARRWWELQKYRLKGDTLVRRAKARGIPMHVCDDVNGSAAHARIREFAPDLLVSMFTMHIYRRETLDLAKVASIGTHPSILPHYRGLEVFFWALANREASSGVSVFDLSAKIDVGRVFLQETFDIEPDETVESIYEKLTRVTARLLSEGVRVRLLGDEPAWIPSEGSGSYFPMPTREAYARFRRSGHRWS